MNLHSTNHRVRSLLLLKNVLVARGIHGAFEQEMHGARQSECHHTEGVPPKRHREEVT